MKKLITFTLFAVLATMLAACSRGNHGEKNLIINIRSNQEIASIGFSYANESHGVQNANNTPLNYNDVISFDMGIRPNCTFTVSVSDRDGNVITQAEFTKDFTHNANDTVHLYVSDSESGGIFITDSMRPLEEEPSASPDEIIASLENDNLLIGYISNIDAQSRTIDFEEIEWLTLNDTDRIAELDLNADYDFPNGFYRVENPNEDKTNYTINDNATFNLIDWRDGFKPITVNLEEFTERHNEINETYFVPEKCIIPYWIRVEDGLIISIQEQFVP